MLMFNKTEKPPIYEYHILFSDGGLQVVLGDSLEPYKNMLLILQGNKSDGYGIVYFVPMERVREITSRKFNGKNATN